MAEIADAGRLLAKGGVAGFQLSKAERRHYRDFISEESRAVKSRPFVYGLESLPLLILPNTPTPPKKMRAPCAPLGPQIKRADAATGTMVGLAALFGGYFSGLLVPAKKKGAGRRLRELPRIAVFWAFPGHALMRGASCRWALTRCQTDAVSRGHEPPGSSTGA